MSGKGRQGSCCGCLLFKFWNLWIRLLGGELTSKNEDITADLCTFAIEKLLGLKP